MSGLTKYYLEMSEAPSERVGSGPKDILVMEAEHKEFRFNRFLYQLVGEPWQWVDRLELDDAAWQREVESDELRTWVAYHRGAILGYYELQRQPQNTVELLYFGIAPRFIGQGYGAYFLSHALESAWGWGPPRRVRVQTCSLDHPAALHNYQARGFRLYRTVKES